MNVVKKNSAMVSGYNVAKKAYLDRWGLPMGTPLYSQWLLADASSPSPNLRASELFLQLVATMWFPHIRVMSFMGYGGTLGEYRHLWLDQPAPDDALWRDFYAPHMRNMHKVSGEYAPAMLLGEVHLVRASLLGELEALLDLPTAGLVKPLEESFNKPFASLDWYGETALGKVPCPDCSNQRGVVIYHPVRLANGVYYLCRNEAATTESGCKGTKAWRANQAWEMTIVELAGTLGFRLSGKAIYQLMCTSSLAQASALLIRDYSNSRGTVERVISQYPTSQVAITTAINIKNGNGEDATGYDLKFAIESNNQEWSSLFREFPVMSEGQIWDIYLD